jgi:ubiquinol-cytochrome c reductase cytochrome c subunit
MRKLALSALLVLAALGPGSAALAALHKDSTEVTAGKHLYGQYCLSCHGESGVGVSQPTSIGAGPLRAQTVQQAVGPSLQGVGALAADFYLRTGYMPLERSGTQPRRSRVSFDEAQIRELTAYVASLGKGPPIPTPRPESGDLSQGQHLFTEHCAGCHQIAAAGGLVTGAIPPSLSDATPRQIAEAVRIGPYVMPRFTKKALSDRELDSVIRYVQYAKAPDDRGGWALGHLGPVPEGLVTWFISAAALVAVCLLIGRRLRA